MPPSPDLEITLKSLASDLRGHYGARYGELILCARRDPAALEVRQAATLEVRQAATLEVQQAATLEVQRAATLEVLLVLEGEVNQMREILRVEPVARLHSSPSLEIAVLPISRTVFERAEEPELWELRFTGSVIAPE